MDKANAKIKFRCKYCGRKFSVPQIHAGKKGKCPKCKNIIVVPKIESTSPKNSDYDLTLLDVPQEYKILDKPLSLYDSSEQAVAPGQKLEELAAEKTEFTAQRKLPWPIDIFLYPMNQAGLITLAIIILIPLMIDFTAALLGPFGFFISIPGFFIKIVIGLYFFWYLAECIRDSAGGGIRAPETIGNAPGLGDLFWQMLIIAGCYIVFVGPVGIYFLYTKRTDVIYWSLLAYAVLFLPMGLLAVVMFDSFSGLNPIIIIGSISSTLLPYCVMIVVFILSGYLIAVKMPETDGSPVLAFVFQCISIYMLLVMAHLLGRFYWRYEDKLNWEV